MEGERGREREREREREKERDGGGGGEREREMERESAHPATPLEPFVAGIESEFPTTIASDA